MRFFLLILFAVFAAACKNDAPANRSAVNNNSVANTVKNINAAVQTAGKLPEYSYDIVNTYPHDPKAFTQGLVFYNNFFYEGTGGRQSDTFHSSLRKVEVESGKVVQKVDLDGKYFGEGITIFNDKIYQITWQEKKAFVYDVNDFKILKEFSYFGEGWGITHDATNLIMSDGTQVLRFINPENFQVVRTLVVTDGKGKEVDEINELEYIKGEIWANVWHSEEIGKPNHIARIDPTSGKLLGWIDLGGISPDDVERDPENTLNGIAYDAERDRIFVTGKNWKKLFEIKIKPKQ